MFRWLKALLWGGVCPACEERGRQIAALEQRVSDLLDRLMARDFSNLRFVKMQEETLKAPAVHQDGATLGVLAGDGLDE